MSSIRNQVMYSCSSKVQNGKNKIHLKIIKGICEGRPNCFVVADNVMFQSSLKCHGSGGHLWMSYSCGNNGIKETIPCQQLQKKSENTGNSRKKSKSFQNREIYEYQYQCDNKTHKNMELNYTLHLQSPKIIIGVGSSADLDGNPDGCSRNCDKDSKQIYDGNLIQGIKHFGPSFQIQFKVLIRKFNGLVLNILNEDQEVVLSVTAEKNLDLASGLSKNKLIVAYLQNFNIKYYRVEHLKRNIWYQLTLAQKQSGENMYEVAAIIF